MWQLIGTEDELKASVYLKWRAVLNSCVSGVWLLPGGEHWREVNAFVGAELVE